MKYLYCPCLDVDAFLSSARSQSPGRKKTASAVFDPTDDAPKAKAKAAPPKAKAKAAPPKKTIAKKTIAKKPPAKPAKKAAPKPPPKSSASSNKDLKAALSSIVNQLSKIIKSL